MTRKVLSASFLTRLGRDIAGNTIALAAAAMIPLAGLIGGGVDMSRLYLTKTRLQQACDAGALAGRKAMGSGSWTTSGTGNTASRASELFSANFKTNAYGTGTLTKSYTESNGTVSGSATVSVPMTIMRVFGMTQRNLSVNCTAKMEIPNTDVMFVLDVTGSMNCAPGTTCSSSSPVSGAKITGLKSAVKCFYEALVKVNTAEVCGNDPTATTYSGTAQIRLGFMPYSVNVNVGKLLPTTYLADNWAYQTRQGVFYKLGTAADAGSYEQTSNQSRTRDCNSWAIGSDATGFPSTSTTPATFTVTTSTYTFVSYNSNTDVCTRRVNQSSTVYTRDDADGTYFHTWIYKQRTLNVSDLKAGATAWNDSSRQRIGEDGDYIDASWAGCIEERQTVKNSDGTPAGEWEPIPTAAYDMNIDMIPSSTTAGSQWGPILADTVWGRYTNGNNTTADVITANDLTDARLYCTTQARKLQSWNTSPSFVTYVNSFTPSGNTYHDIGMLWGARFLSPTGIFASENAATSNGGAIQRHLIFMTDGDTQTATENYSAYGASWWDRRQTTYAPNDTNLDDIVNARLTALCTAIKNKNITLWVVSYGGNVNATTEARLTACATPGKFFSASSTATLISNFKQIASEIAELRLTS